ncbi:hypothetical protein C499_07325 [Halogeometricum borinquense DSM 11551]|uniref:Uncharacterized protein n=2 Tax=Halogeometricum borinquense TaxID=60847 RepID=E4NVG4_HALBP|nr:hypothetical protein [Halogeometricum borinquense]ADQ68848.1 hypothetical protein Hbor_33230 [Halogeometricum borinquense DSM 11551]ELY28723.1 hypothetical protein C499_07325 [Halogeometricum borinquense DSM 11551]RYJ14312.1 hypothetical protein ELS19_10330 [Halogeometricum borinquense]
MPDNEVTQTRRGVLKSTAGLGVLTLGLGSGAGVAAADPNKFEQGTVRFVEIKEEYEAPSDAPTISRTGTAGYALDQSRGVLTLTNAPVELFREHDTVVAAGGDYYPVDKSVQITNSERGLPVNTNYRQLGAQYAVVDQVQAGRSVHVQAEGSGVRVSADSIDLEVSVGQEVADSGRPESVADSTDESATPLERRVQTRNHGEVTVFGHDDYLVLPLASGDNYAQARVESILALADEHASKIEEADLVAVPKDVDIIKGGE